jgi:hypothetical protein
MVGYNELKTVILIKGMRDNGPWALSRVANKIFFASNIIQPILHPVF